MAIQKTLKFVKQANGGVILQNLLTNSVIASFNPAQSVVRESEDSYRFKIVSGSSSDEDGFLLDYRTIDVGLCVPQIIEANVNDFLIELSKKFFFLAKGGHTPYLEGELLIFKRAGNQKQLELEINDYVMGIVEGQFIQGTCINIDPNQPLLTSFDIFTRNEF